MNDKTETDSFADAVIDIFGETFADILGISPQQSLRGIIEQAKAEHGLPLGELTVLAAQRDPFRLDTPANHAVGQWLADAYAEVFPEPRRLHLRALHYALVGRVTLPDGKPYQNNDETWLFLSEKAAKAARYLGYLPWHLVRDARNAPPQIYTPQFDEPQWRLKAGEIELYLPETLTPEMVIEGDLYRQPWRQVVIGEKAGIEDVLLDVCKRRKATLALPAGEISDTMVFEILRDAAEDGRPLAVHWCADFDPAGNQMAVSGARTIQALVASQFPDLRVVVHPVTLTRDQCIDWDLPSTPLKDTEKRGDRWLAAMGREQTELDSAVALRPRDFAETVERSLLQYYDTSLANRAAEKRRELEAAANERLADTLGEERLAEIRQAAEAKLDDLESLVEQVNQALAFDPAEAGVEIPDEPEVLVGDTACRDDPLLDTDGDWVEQTRRLIQRKRY
jgi:hypothetical protein